MITHNTLRTYWQTKQSLRTSQGVTMRSALDSTDYATTAQQDGNAETSLLPKVKDVLTGVLLTNGEGQKVPSSKHAIIKHTASAANVVRKFASSATQQSLQRINSFERRVGGKAKHQWMHLKENKLAYRQKVARRLQGIIRGRQGRMRALRKRELLMFKAMTGLRTILTILVYVTLIFFTLFSACKFGSVSFSLSLVSGRSRCHIIQCFPHHDIAILFADLNFIFGIKFEQSQQHAWIFAGFLTVGLDWIIYKPGQIIFTWLLPVAVFWLFVAICVVGILVFTFYCEDIFPASLGLICEAMPL